MDHMGHWMGGSSDRRANLLIQSQCSFLEEVGPLGTKLGSQLEGTPWGGQGASLVAWLQKRV